MNIHIDKKLAVIIIVTLLVGGAIGACIGVTASHEEGRGGHEKYGMKYDDQADGETIDDQGTATSTIVASTSTASTTSKVK